MRDRCRTFAARCILDAKHDGAHEYMANEDTLTLRAALDEAVGLLRDTPAMNCAAALHDSTCWCNRRIAFLSTLPGSADAKGTR